MKQVVICRKDLTDGDRHQVLYKTHFEMEGMTVHCALIDIQPIDFDTSHPSLARQVLVKKKGFTCNYRDKGIILEKAQKYTNAVSENNENQAYSSFVGIGSDYVAEVVAVGSEVTELVPGDRVINNGSYPDRHHLPNNMKHYKIGLPTNEASSAMEIVHCQKVLKIPSAMSNTTAASFTIGGQTSLSMVRRLNLRPGDNVLITAAKSNTSIFALAGLTHRKDINIFVASTNTNHIDYLKNQGVKEVLLIDESRSLFQPGSLEKVPIYGFDAVIDPFWDIYLQRVIHHMAYGGRYITCGLQRQYDHITGRQYQTFDKEFSNVITTALLKNVTIMGNCLGWDEDLEKAVALHSAGKFHIEIDNIFEKGKDLSLFFDRTYNRKDRLGKVVFQYEN